MPNDLLTTEQILEEVRVNLGGSSVEVEVEDKDLKVMVARTLRVYNRYLPWRGRAKLAVTTSQKKYRLDNLHPGLMGVIDADFISRLISPSSVDPFDPYVTSLAGPNYGDETFGDVMQRRMYTEDASRIISSEPEWFAQWEVVAGTRQYFMYVDVQRANIECGYTFQCHYADTDALDVGRLAIPESDTDWFINHVTALGKQLLARVRGKHGGVINSDGSTDPVDSDSDRQEATAELEALIAEIKLRKPPYLPAIE